jgi:hypothetical protein
MEGGEREIYTAGCGQGTEWLPIWFTKWSVEAFERDIKITRIL